MKSFYRHYIGIIIVFITCLWLNGCNITENSESENGKVILSVVDVSVRETYLKMKVNDPLPNEYISLERNGTEVYKGKVQDIVYFTDTSLTENTAYKYVAVLKQNEVIRGLSKELTAQTLSPSGHDIQWQIFPIGRYGMDIAKDVTIIDENNIWVAGDFHQNNTTYLNLAKWNSMEWTYDKSKLGDEFSYSPFNSIFSFSDSEVWTGSNLPQYWNGKNWGIYTSKSNYPDNFWITSIWGASSSQMYFSGEGSLVKYDGHSWKELFKGESSSGGDLWGVKDTQTGEVTVYMAYYDYWVPENSKILKISGSTDKIEYIDIDNNMRNCSLWTNKGFPLFTCGGFGLFSNKTGRWTKEPLTDTKFMNSIRGNGLNDIFVAGDYGFLAHWNGLTWKVYDEFSDNAGSIFKIAVKGNTITAVGMLRGAVVAIIGKRS